MILYLIDSAIAFLTANGTFIVALFGYKNFFRSFITIKIYIKIESYVKEIITNGILARSQLPIFALNYALILGVFIMET